MAEQEFDSVQSNENLESQKDEKNEISVLLTRRQIYEWKLDTWIDNHRHWYAPTNFIVYSNGDWFGYATALSNQLRTGGLIDRGVNWNFMFRVQYKNSSGLVIHENKYRLDNLNYKEERHDVSNKGNDPFVSQHLNEIASASLSRWFWR